MSLQIDTSPTGYTTHRFNTHALAEGVTCYTTEQVARAVSWFKLVKVHGDYDVHFVRGRLLTDGGYKEFLYQLNTRRFAMDADEQLLNRVVDEFRKVFSVKNTTHNPSLITSMANRIVKRIEHIKGDNSQFTSVEEGKIYYSYEPLDNTLSTNDENEQNQVLFKGILMRNGITIRTTDKWEDLPNSNTCITICSLDKTKEIRIPVSN